MAHNPENIPFPLRGHHTRNITRYRTTELSPEEDASRIRKIFERGRRTIIGRYARDVVGNTREEGYRYESGMRTFLKAVKDLSEDHPVELIAGKPDGICKSCAVGHHCSKDNNFYEDIGYNHAVVAKAIAAGHPVEVARQGGMITSALMSAGALFEVSADLKMKDHLRSLVVTYVAEAKRNKIKADIRTRTSVRESYNVQVIDRITDREQEKATEAALEAKEAIEADITTFPLLAQPNEVTTGGTYLGKTADNTVFQRYGLNEQSSNRELPQPLHRTYHLQGGYEVEE